MTNKHSEEEMMEEVAAVSEFEEMDEAFELNPTEKPADKRSSKKSSKAQNPVLAPEDERIESNMNEAWYVVHCYSGYEKKVCHNLEQRMETIPGMKEKILDAVVPTQEEVEVRDGKRKPVTRNIFPGYVLVKMILTEESWFVVRNTPGVTGFIGMGKQPTPLRPEEEKAIFKRMEAKTPNIHVTFNEGEKVHIVDGPFNGFHGTVSSIDMDRSKVRVMVNFFGRETPVELDFLQIEKS